ncbi:PLP-dependent aminotransferase family protein [Mesobacillus foraminis]|nr:PLP-dependent aminotransferase family protein [Mesobacillus foraminis]
MSDRVWDLKELLFQLDEMNPKYKQIYQTIRSLIEKAELKANTKLPSIRQLADLLQVSRNTTLTAYEQLLAEGYIRSEPKRGYFVEEYEPMHLQCPKAMPVKSQGTELPAFVDFRAGTVDMTAFPIKAWRQCSNEVLREEIAYTYGNVQGDPHLRANLAHYLLQSRGIRTSPDAIIVGSSTQQLLMHLTILLKKDCSAIAVENPGYDGARTIFSLQGFTIQPIDITAKGISVKQLEQTDSRVVYITPSHQFPTGVTMPVAERQQLLKWARQNNGYIIEDDYDSEFRYKQQPIPALSSIGNPERVIYLSTFSKAFLPSIRLSYMILPPSLLVRYQQLFSSVEQTASSLHQRTMALFMERGYWDSHIRKMRANYKRKMQRLVSALEGSFGETVKIIGFQSGLYILIQIQSSISEENLISQAAKNGVKVYPTSQYYLGKESQKTILQLGFSNLSMEEIDEGVRLLHEAWSKSINEL